MVALFKERENTNTPHRPPHAPSFKFHGLANSRLHSSYMRLNIVPRPPALNSHLVLGKSQRKDTTSVCTPPPPAPLITLNSYNIHRCSPFLNFCFAPETLKVNPTPGHYVCRSLLTPRVARSTYHSPFQPFHPPPSLSPSHPEAQWQNATTSKTHTCRKAAYI